MATTPFNIPLSIFRNRVWPQTVVLSEDLHLDTFALIVLPSSCNGSSLPVMAVIDPTITLDSGSTTLTFIAGDIQTGKLISGSDYQWQILWKPTGGDDSTVIAAGPLAVSDSPPFPTEAV